jgi:hypothetical protein
MLIAAIKKIIHAMLHTWMRVLKCSDVEPGEIIRVGVDPHTNTKGTVVEEVTENMIKLANGSAVQDSDLSTGEYWHKFVQSVW